jgi:hypothetical protein
VALRIDVGVHTERDARRRALGPGARGDAIELAGRLGVDGFQAERDRAIQLLAGLADAGEDDLVGDQAGAQRDLDLAARVGVGRRAEPAQQAHQRQRRVGLQRVVDGVRVARERLIETLIGLADGVRVVNVGRRADVGGNAHQQRRVDDRALGGLAYFSHESSDLSVKSAVPLFDSEKNELL